MFRDGDSYGIGIGIGIRIAIPFINQYLKQIAAVAEQKKALRCHQHISAVSPLRRKNALLKIQLC